MQENSAGTKKRILILHTCSARIKSSVLPLLVGAYAIFVPILIHVV
jgi:hypothetical protein